MGSTMTVMPSKHNSSGIFGSTKPQPVWLQFVPGIVLDVIINNESPAYKDERDINCILAKSHINPGRGIKLKGTTKKKYAPLFRGVTDTPIKGDQVLLCTFGGVNYYMGPINTVNSPNWNIDHMNLQSADEMGGLVKFIPGAKKLNKYGLSSTFKATSKVKRMQKKFNKDLDDSLNLFDVEKLLETHGDMMFEGRHGNSMRLGSRDMNPYILFSNGRQLGNESESNFDGTIMLFSDDGTIHQHFPNDVVVEEEKEEPVPILFTLASDLVGEDKEEGQKRLISVKDIEDSESKGLYDYEWNKPQVFLNSDKITFNAKKESIFLSAFQEIVLGAGNALHIITENETIIESSNIYLGRQSKFKKDEGGDAEPMVLGEQLRIFLEDLITILEESTGMCQGAPIPVMDSTQSPIKIKLQQLKQKISDITTAPFNSEYHYIEDNGNKPE